MSRRDKGLIDILSTLCRTKVEDEQREVEKMGGGVALFLHTISHREEQNGVLVICYVLFP